MMTEVTYPRLTRKWASPCSGGFNPFPGFLTRIGQCSADSGEHGAGGAVAS